MAAKKNRSALHSAASALKSLGIVFTIVGLLVAGLFIFLAVNESRYDEKYDAVTVTIVDISSHIDNDGDTTHTVMVAYEYKGIYYDFERLGSYTSSMYEGQRLTVYIDPSGDPTNLKYKMGFGFYFVFMMIGAIFAVVGISVLMIGLHGNQKKRLVDKEQGEPVYATVTSVGKTSMTVNNMTTYRVIATWEDQYGIAHEYKSEYLLFDPALYINVGELIRVYVDPNNYKKYYMCAQELQSEDPEYQQYSEY